MNLEQMVHGIREFLDRVIQSSPAAIVASEVPSPWITSTSFMTGTGFMKCIPMYFSGAP